MKRQSKPRALNVSLLLKAKAAILREPKQFVMNNWFSEYTDIKKNKYKQGIFGNPASLNAYEIPNCHTAACIAGWIVTCHEGTNPVEARDRLDCELNTGRFASRLLKRRDEVTADLFFVRNWPKRFKTAWQRTHSPAKRAIIAGKVIDDFIRRNQ